MSQLGQAMAAVPAAPASAGQVLRGLWRPLRVLVPVAILVVVAAHVGTEPFVAALRATSPGLVAAALAVTAGTTICNAWRWRTVAAGLGLDIPLPTAVAACYRSQLLNASLPLGILGDVHRGVGHGLSSGQVGRGVRAVVSERTVGQAVQLVVAAVVLLVLPSPIPPLVALAAGGAGLAVVAAVLVGLPGGGLLRVVAASCAATAGHVVVFLLAVRATAADLPAASMVPLALVVLLVAAVPLNLAGWGPREGAAAWAFSAVGLAAGQGVEVSVVYGVLAFVATLPGVVVLALGRGRWSAVPSGPGRGDA